MNQSKNLFNKVKGTRDFYPENWQFQNWLSQKWLQVGQLFGYQEYEAPVLEPIELYLEKSSKEIIKDQTFTLLDRGGETLVMRPELTPSLARMVAAKENELTFPIRWQSWGRFWRYEKPQRGRGREFFQWNIDILGVDSPETDTEIIEIACLALKNLGITPAEAQIKVNDRESLEVLLLNKLSLQNNQIKPLLKAIDRIDKLEPEAFNDWLLELGFTRSQIDNLLQILKSTSPDFSPRLTKIINSLSTEAKPYVQIDLKIVRGFDYYTSFVFEAWANTSLKRSLFGGGRYDNLTKQVGGKKTIPGVGFAVGDMTMFELLNELKKPPVFDPSLTKIFVSTFSSETYQSSLSLANLLRQNNLNCELNTDLNLKIGAQFKYADKKGIPFIAIIGPDEIKDNKVTLKDLGSGQQKLVSTEELVTILR